MTHWLYPAVVYMFTLVRVISSDILKILWTTAKAVRLREEKWNICKQMILMVHKPMYVYSTCVNC